MPSRLRRAGRQRGRERRSVLQWMDGRSDIGNWVWRARIENGQCERLPGNIDPTWDIRADYAEEEGDKTYDFNNDLGS